jgi:RHS repeat-associated protein
MTPAETISTANQSTQTDYRARYYSDNDARFMSPDWSAKVEPVPYAKLGDPQSLNLYSYVLNNPLSAPDIDGHQCANGECDTGNPFLVPWSSVAQSPYAQGAGKIGLGVGLIVTGAGADVPGDAVGAVLITNAIIGASGSVANGTVQIVGAATHVNTSHALEKASKVESLAGVTTGVMTRGNLNAAGVATTATNAATLALSPKEAVRNVATAVDSAQTVKETGGFLKNAISGVINWFSPPPPPTPKAPAPPSCSVAGACDK